MGKQRIGVLIRESVGKGGGNKSTDLAALRQKYDVFCKKLQALIHSLKQHHACMAQIAQTRASVARNFAALSKQTPLWECTGLLPSADHPSDTVCSYASVHDTLGAKSKAYATKYQQFVIEYAVEWEKVITTRINGCIKTTEEQRRELDHYQKKVEALRLTVNQAMAKGKNIKSDVQEKLRRNEEKLLAAKQSYNKGATDLCILLEEITERSWRDLHPLLLKCAQFDSTLAGDESKVLASLNSVVAKLKTAATANGISPQPRIKDLANLKPELLSTRPGGVSGLTIEAGAGPLGNSVHSNAADAALPPGTVTPQGIGGFPVQVAASSSSSDPFAPNSTSPTNAVAAAYDPVANLGILTLAGGPPGISSAPPPTMDDVYYASSPSAPNSGSLPPLGPSRTNFGPPGRTTSGDSFYSNPGMPPMPPPNANKQRTSSYDNDSLHSGYSGYSGGGGGGASLMSLAQPVVSSGTTAPNPFAAPAPAVLPPPPPSMPPPPPPPGGGAPTMSMYGGAPPPSLYSGAAPGWNTAPPPPPSSMYGNSFNTTSTMRSSGSSTNPFDH